MEDHHPAWLPHLTGEVVHDARGYELDAYAVALEGWRRGLTLKWHSHDSEKFKNMATWNVDTPGKLFSLSSGERTHYFFRTRGDKVTNEAVEIGGDKARTKAILEERGVAVPEGKAFHTDAPFDEIIDYATTLGFPVVLKPVDGSFGRGVITNIRDEASLVKALKYVREELHYADLLVERHIPGKEHRLYVVGEHVTGALHRIPANVTGDGVHSIAQLIEIKNEEKKQNPRLYSCLIKIDQEIENHLEARGMSLETVPEKGQRIFLREKSNISMGGDPVDVLDDLPEGIKAAAVKALKAIPGLAHGAVDLIIDERDRSGVVLEVNPTAQIGSLLFPAKGRARDIPAAIIDYYFPETIDINTDKAILYFDFPTVLEPLRSKFATKSRVTPYPSGKLYAKKYTVSGVVDDIGYHRGLRKEAFERGLSGYVTVLNRELIEVVVAGTCEKEVEQYREAILNDPERSEVWHIEEEDWDQPVKIGFEVDRIAPAKTATEMERLLEERKALEEEWQQAKRQLDRYRRSISWILTYPARKMADLFKFLYRTFV